MFHVDAYESAKMLCDQYYLSSPDLVLQELNSKDRWNIFMFMLNSV